MLTALRASIERLGNVRPGEWRLAFPSFVALFLTIAAHTTVETARDAIFLARLQARDLTVVYVALAGITIGTTFASTKLTLALGRRRALVCSLVGIAAITALFFFLAPTKKAAVALYVFSGVEGAMLVPQFWLLADDLFTVAQARRLFGPITSGGVVGGIAGAGSAALLVRVFPVTVLLPFAAAMFVVAAVVVATVRGQAENRACVATQADPSPARTPQRSPFRDHPLLIRIAAVAALSTSAALVVDYLFKSTAARYVPPESLGFFFARYYAVMNGLSLIFQVLIAGRLLRRVGVIGAAAVTPLVLALGGLAAVIGQGAFVLVLCLKTFDGGLRYSLNRVASELLYLPVALGPRQRAKGFIDGALIRVVQALSAGLLYFMAIRSIAGPRVLACVVVVLCTGWFALAVTLRGPYLDLFRRTLARPDRADLDDEHELDMTSAEALVEAMASTDPIVVVAAMDVLDQHRRMAIIPALILYHESPPVLIRALTLFASSKRTDWAPLAERLVGHQDDSVVAAALSALARAGRVDALERAARHPGDRVQTYVGFYQARRDAVDVLASPLISSAMRASGDSSRAARRVLLDVVSDAPDERSIDLLIALGELPEFAADEEAVSRFARAVAELKSERLVATSIERLAKRAGRDAIRNALVAIGDPALDALEALLHNEHADWRLRLHAPRTISRFGSQRAADVLVKRLLHEPHGMIRYKLLRALGQLLAHSDVKVDGPQMALEAERTLRDYMRMLSSRAALAAEPARQSVEQLVLSRLIEDKLNQAMERAFRLLQIAHPREHIESVHDAARSADKTLRANAGEFLDALLVRRSQQPLRRLLRIVVDDASDVERARWAKDEVLGLPQTLVEVLTKLMDENDEVLVALAARHALTLNDEGLRGVVSRLRKVSPSIEATNDLLFGAPIALDGATLE